MLAFASPEKRAAYLAARPLEPVTGRTITAARAFEAQLAAIRRRGYAEEREEFVEGVCCVSAPVLFDGALVAAFTVSAPAQRYGRHRSALRDAVLDAGASAARALASDVRMSA
jgi:DNA-binding IclR family transcriptional regulator